MPSVGGTIRLPDTERFFGNRKAEITKESISNGNRTEWNPIRSVIILVIKQIGLPLRGRPILLITRMSTDRIGRHEVLLPINHNFNKICDIIGYFLNQNTRNSKFCFASSEKKIHLSARSLSNGRGSWVVGTSRGSWVWVMFKN